VIGTGTDIGKTWMSARLLSQLREAGVSVAARKPAQSFDAKDDPEGFDAAILGAATGEPVEVVCPPHRWYPVAMAPPMAADVLGRPSFTIEHLVQELQWSGPTEVGSESGAGDEAPVVGLVETAGGLRSPLASDGDCLDYCRAVAPDLVVLVADAGLGTINSVRLTMDALAELDAPVVVVLNRFDCDEELHLRNRTWLRTEDGFAVLVLPGDEQMLMDLALS